MEGALGRIKLRKEGGWWFGCTDVLGCVYHRFSGLESAFSNVFQANLHGDKRKPVFKRL